MTRKPLSFNVDAAPATAAPALAPAPAAANDVRRTSPTSGDRKQVGARVSGSVYRQLKAQAALQGAAVGDLVEQAITEFLERHRAG